MYLNSTHVYDTQMLDVIVSDMKQMEREIIFGVKYVWEIVKFQKILILFL